VLRDGRSGKEVRTFDRGEERGVMAALSPDGHLAASMGRGTLFVWEAHTAKLLYKKPKAGLAVTFCPAGLLLATAGTKVQIWDAATGLELAQLREESKFGWKSLAFSPDGRLIAFAEDDRAFLCDLATRNIFHQLPGHRMRLTSLAFAPDGQTLVTGAEDGTALVWDLAEVVPLPKHVPVEASEVPGLWKEMKKTDRLAAYPAFLRLRQAPELTTAFLSKELGPMQAPTPERLGELLKDLDSPTFAVRTKAAEELEKLGNLAEPALKEALKKDLTVETAQRMQKLLATVGSSPELVRQQWALRLLEGHGTAEARALLERLAGGAAEAQLTREARLSLERVERKQGK
jgi:hypothetical protein